MRTIKDLKEMRAFSERAKNHGKKIGFVPTMGSLHEGHLSLVAAAKRKSDIVVVSIFVNPMQFGPNEDFKHYPRHLRHDINLLKNFEIDALFLPEANKLYPDKFAAAVEVGELSKKMCGKSRPAHFRGVTTVLTKLFNIVVPDLAFFGEKDYQQLIIVRRLVQDLNLPIEIISQPTVRDFDGLALSSRNKLLNVKERRSATILHKALSMAKTEIETGERDVNKILFRMRSLIGSEPTVRLDYIVIAHPETLEDVKAIKGKLLIALAAYVGTTRLIDNLMVDA
ncbi:MAG: pantoate--beta-alanine ligase [Candidatus Margulisbacteria bacterium]|nr:pantoate--beta-alanine ligase [Candidatus Margulisiibacteriota bacterium]